MGNIPAGVLFFSFKTARTRPAGVFVNTPGKPSLKGWLIAAFQAAERPVYKHA